jgi:hypothetical protein
MTRKYHVGKQPSGLQPTERLRTCNPLLPFAAQPMKQRNDEMIKGKRGFVAQSRCWPAYRAIAVSSGADLFHPDTQESLDHLARPPCDASI